MKNFVERMEIKPVLIVPVFIVSFLLDRKNIFWKDYLKNYVASVFLFFSAKRNAMLSYV